MTKRRVHTHPFLTDPVAAVDWRGRPTCAECYLPKSNSIHELPETTQEARERDASILGEKEEA